MYRLTPRQLEISKLLLLTNKEISKKLCISESTVKVTIHTIITNTDSRTRAEVLVKLLREKLIAIEDIEFSNNQIEISEFKRI